MKTRNWLILVIAALGTLSLVVGIGFDNLVGMSSTSAPAEVETNLKTADLEIFNFDSENINQALREYDALMAIDREIFNFDSENINQKLREYESLKATDSDIFNFNSENINQKLREYETLTQRAQTEPDDGPQQREVRFNLPEGS